MSEDKHPTDIKIDTLLNEKFHLFSLYPFQRLVITRILEQEGLYGEERVREGRTGQLIILPTGSGKSVCFTLPAMLLEKATLIIYPLLSLMADQKRRMEELQERPVIIKGGQSAEEREELFSSLAHHHSKIILATAEALEQESVRNRLRKIPIGLIVIDEAHVIALWGMSFRPSYLRLKESIRRLNVHQILAFTATADKHIIAIINSVLSPDKGMHLIKGNIDRENIYYQVIPTLSKIVSLYSLIKEEQLRPAIVFFRSRDMCEIVAKELLKRLRSPIVRHYHAGLAYSERKASEQWFFNHPSAVLCATSAYGMGVDKKDIRTVVHWDLPEDVASFLQESGRGGRDGKPFYSITLIDFMKESAKEDPFRSIFFDASSCRRERLLQLMGGECDSCSGCDICNHTVIGQPLGEKEIVKAIGRAPFRYTPSTLAHHLCGTPFRSIDPHSPFYKVLSSWRYEELFEAIQSLIKVKRIFKTAHNHLYILSSKQNRIKKKIERVLHKVKKIGHSSIPFIQK